MKTLDKKNIQDVMRCTPMQEGMLFHTLEAPEGLQYISQLCVGLSGLVEPETVESAWNCVAGANDALRTVFQWERVSHPLQLVLKRHAVQFAVEDLSRLPEDGSIEALEEFKRKDRRQGFDFQSVPFRVTLVCMPNQRFQMVVCHHHILYDGWSNGILLKEFFSSYNDLSSNKTPDLPSKISFKDYLKWLGDQDDDLGKEYWSQYLAGVSEPTLYSGRIRPTTADSSSMNITREIPAALIGSVESLCHTQHLTPASVFYLAWGILLHRDLGLGDVLFGTAVSGRPGDIEGIEQLVGMCVNTLPLRVAIDEAQTQLAAALRVQLALQSRQPVEHTPLVKISSYLPNSAAPLFDTVVIVENYPLEDQAFNAGKVTADSYSVFEMTNFSLAIGVTLGERANLNVAFRESSIERWEVEALLDRYLIIIQSIVNAPYNQVGAIQLLSEKKKEELLYTFNDIAHDVPADVTLVGLVGEQAERTPDAVALVGRSLLGDKKGLEHHINYRDMWTRAGQLAALLEKRGIGSGSIVGVMMPRRLELAEVLVAIMRCGAAYLPLAVDAPVERTNAMIENSGVEWVLGSGLDNVVEGVDYVDIADLMQSDSIAPDYGNNAAPDDCAYVIYTSGSTGVPKGVAIRHRSVVNTLLFRKDAYGLGGDHRALQLFPYIFDGFVTSFFTPLIAGAAVILPAAEDILDLELMASVIARQRVSHFISTPSLFQLIIDRLSPTEAATLQAITLAGEACTPYLLEAARQKNPNLEIVNEYGVTEASVLSTIYRHQEQDDTIKAGVPIWNTSLYIVDSHNRLLPLGVYGELCLAGVGLADGYLNREDLTEGKFIENPFVPGTRLYKTGDRARRLADGTLQLAGRMDRQVKVRGFRIEPAEIEALLLKHEAVREVAVSVKEGIDSEPALCAYLVSEKALSSDKLRSYLNGLLPFYMIPNHFLQLDELPKTQSGKINYIALPHPDSLDKKRGFVAPVKRMESIIASVWQEILKRESIGIHDNFFDLGGNSLVAIRVAGKMKEKLNREIPVLMLFRYPTVAAMAGALEGVDSGETRSVQRQAYDIACIGMAARLPEAANVREFWENLVNGDECVRRFTREELLESGVPGEMIDNPSYVPAKGYLECVDYFDPEFFGYTPAQAAWMDPQVRILHECSWEALEDAGYDPNEYQGAIGLYAGANLNFPWLMHKKDLASSPSEEFELVTLNSNSFATLVAYRLNLKGPAVTIQSACSTSLVAIDSACQGLLSHRCDMALAGGASVILPAKSGYLYQEGMVKSPDGHCRAFDANANGTSSGDGVGVVVLKPLDQALKDNDQIYAVIKGSAVNNDGNRRAGYSAPGPDGQAEVIRNALDFAGVESNTIGYIEAHGTGTPLGDPIEIQGLTLAFGSGTPGSCGIGSVKTNIGHLDAAAGVAGFIKVCLALRHGVIPPSLNYETKNPAIDFERSPFYVVSQLQQWTAGAEPRRAGVSSFGIGGTNAHVVLEEAPEPETLEQNAQSVGSRRYHLLPLSARSADDFAALTTNLSEFLRQNDTYDIGNVAFTLQTGRRHFGRRGFVVCKEGEDASKVLTKKAAKHDSFHAPQSAPQVVFMFPGLGGQYQNMGRELYETEPTFRAIIDDCGQLSQSIIGFDIRSRMFPANESSDGMNDSFLANQALIFALEYSLAQLLMEWGIQPSAMIGYSFGEYVAACVAGVMSLEDAIRLVVSRGRVIEECPAGSMTSVPLPKEEVVPMLGEALSLAIDNGPSCIVAGEPDVVEAFEKTLKQNKTFCMRVPNTHALHSHMMDSALAAFEKEMRKIELQKPVIPYVSNVTGTWVDENDAVDPGYWVRHLRQTVRFSEGIETITRQGDTVYIEVGPGRDLRSLLMRCLDDQQASRVVNLLPPEGYDRGADDYLLHRLGYLWQEGVAVDWRKFNHHHQARRVSLPSYPFNKQYYPVDSPTDRSVAQKTASTSSPHLSDWFYIPQWRRQPLKTVYKHEELDDSGFIIFTGSGANESAIASQLQEHFGKNVDIIDPTDPGAISQCFSNFEQQGAAVGSIVYIVPECAESPEYFSHLLEISKFLPPFAVKRDIWLSVITFNVFDVTGKEAIHPDNALAIGPMKVIPQEVPGVHCRHIDVVFPVDIKNLVKEFSESDPGDVIALRDKHRWTLHYEQVNLEEPAQGQSLLKHEGVYLVTGGLGNIGYEVCRYLLSDYHARLVIVGRTRLAGDQAGDAGKKAARFKELSELPGDTQYFAVDVADYASFQAVVSVAEERFGSFDGVFHFAGIIDDESIASVMDLSSELCDKQFKVKREGALVLEKIFKKRHLDFCWLTSSIATVLGGIHFFGYAAGNAWVDGFGRYMNLLTKYPWFVVNWDALEPAQVISAIERVLSGGLREVVISTGGGLEERIDQWIRLRALEEVADAQSKPVSLEKRRPGILGDYVAPRNENEKIIAGVWSEIFGYSEIGVNDDFFELGGDSLKALTALSKMHRLLGREIPIQEMFARPTISKLAASIDSKTDHNYQAIPKAPDMDHYPLSSAQKRLYVLQQMELDSVAYNETLCVAIEGKVDRERIEATYQKLIERHESLRTSIVQINGEARQVVHASGTVKFKLEILEGKKTAHDEHILDFIRPFDLSKPPFFRSCIAETERFGPIMIIDMHHSITDAVSLQVFIDEFTRLYNGEELPVITHQYRDYAVWQQAKKNSPEMKVQMDYWVSKYKRDIPVLELPTDYARTTMHDYEGRGIKCNVPREQVELIRALSMESGSTTFMILLAAYYMFLARISGQNDLVVGVPVAGRPHAECQDMIGIFVNTLAMRHNVDLQCGFNKLLSSIKQHSIEAFEHQECQFEELVEQLDIKRDPSRNPLFDNYFVYEVIGLLNINAGESIFKALTQESRVSKFDLVFNVLEEGEDLILNLEYSISLFKHETADRLLKQFLILLKHALANPDEKLVDIDFLSDEEKEIILNRFNDNKIDFPKEQTVWDLIQLQAEKNGDRLAMVCEGRKVTYSELVRGTRSISSWYVDNGMRGGQLLGVLLDRSIEMAMSILAAWDIGAAYIPLDSRHPSRRIMEVTDNANCRFLVSVDSLVADELASVYEGTILRMTPEIFQREVSDSSAAVDVNSTAYVFFTSGSTGKPKGAMVEQVGMTNHMFAKINDLNIDEHSVVAQNASHTFDISIWQFFVGLITGGRTVIYPNHLVLDPDTLMTQVEDDGITILEVVPSYLAVMLDALEVKPLQFPKLRSMIVTGEVVKPHLVARWFASYPHIQMVNAYGPTEAADEITHFMMDGPVEGERVPVGKSIQNMTIYIVDDQGRLCPIGTKGEIWVSGIGVGRGYVNDHERTMKVFDIDPFSEEKGIRLYKTGDLGRWLPDGSIDFFGRKDFQVKIRGFRIELGEIENRLLSLGLAREAIVIDREDEKGEKMLCAYVVPKESLTPADIRQRLKEVLPDYMVPATVTLMDSLPLNDNGKIDRKALPDPKHDDDADTIPYVSNKQLEELSQTPDGCVMETADRIDQEIHDQQASKEDIDKILNVFNNTAAPFPKDLTVVQLFQQQAWKNPDRVALVFEDRHLSYGEMDRRTSNCAAAIATAGAGAGSFVGLLADRSLELVMGVYAILKAGAAYVPLSAEFPEERMRYIIDACDVRLVLGDDVDAVDSVDVVDIVDALGASGNREEIELPLTSSSDPAYVMFTSGTTGQPKGVVVEHRSLVNFSLAMVQDLGLTMDDIVLSLFTLTFDMSGTEIFAPLVNGQKVVLGNFEEQLHTDATAAVLTSRCVTVFQATPSNLQLLVGDEARSGCLKGLRLVLAGAEPFPPALFQRLRQWSEARIFNLYGPTEATTYATYSELTNSERITIGKPIDNARVYIVNSSGGLQPIGVPGELHIGGEGVARGYIKQEDLTRQAFATDPFQDGGRIYKTGDIACFQEDGDIIFMGRRDHQVQIEGFRVELAEIEHCLANYPEVQQVAVLAGIDSNGKKYLVAYIVAGSRLLEANLRVFLSQKLPPFMIPGYFVQLEQMPLNPNGKVDRRKLPAPSALSKSEVEFVAPSTELEETVAAVWRQVLQVDRVGVNENFFDLGGNSLGVIQLNRILKEKLQRDIPVVAMYEHLTIKAFVRFLQQHNTGKGQSSPQPQADRSAALSKARDRRSQQKNKRRLN